VEWETISSPTPYNFCVQKSRITRMSMPDFRLPPGSTSELCSSGLLCCIITLKSAVLKDVDLVEL
jgi:hypothetical protein